MGSPRAARFKTYERLKTILDRQGDKRDLFFTDQRITDIRAAMQDIYDHPLFQSATDILNRHLRISVNDQDLVDLLLDLRSNARLAMIQAQDRPHQPMRIICSMGLTNTGAQP